MTDAIATPDLDRLPGDTTLLLKMWNRRAVIALDAHYEGARYYGNKNYGIGIPAVVFATLVGTAVFATLEREVQLWLRIVVGLLSIAAAVLSALQTFLAYSEKSEKHRMTGARYGAIARELELLIALSTDARFSDPEKIASLGEQLKAVAADAPTLPDKLWAEAKKRHPKEF